MNTIVMIVAGISLYVVIVVIILIVKQSWTPASTAPATTFPIATFPTFPINTVAPTTTAPTPTSPPVPIQYIMNTSGQYLIANNGTAFSVTSDPSKATPILTSTNVYNNKDYPAIKTADNYHFIGMDPNTGNVLYTSTLNGSNSRTLALDSTSYPTAIYAWGSQPGVLLQTSGKFTSTLSDIWTPVYVVTRSS